MHGKFNVAVRCAEFGQKSSGNQLVNGSYLLKFVVQTGKQVAALHLIIKYI